MAALFLMSMIGSTANALEAKNYTHMNSSLTNHIGQISAKPEIWMWHSSAISRRDYWDIFYYNFDKDGVGTFHRIYNSDVKNFYTGRKVFVDDIVVYYGLSEQVKKFISVYGLENLGIKISVGKDGSVNNNVISYSISGDSLKIVFRPVLRTDHNDLWKNSPIWASMNSYGKIDIPKVTAGYGKNYVSSTVDGVSDSTIITDAFMNNAKIIDSNTIGFNNGGNVSTSNGKTVPMSSVTLSTAILGGGAHGVYFEYPITIDFYDLNITSKDITIDGYEYYKDGVYWVKSGDDFNVNVGAYTSNSSNEVKVNSQHLRVGCDGNYTFIDGRMHSSQNSISKWVYNSNVVNFVSGKGNRNGNSLDSTYTISVNGDKNLTLKGLSRLVKFNSDFSSEKIYKEAYTNNTLTVKSDSTAPTITFPYIPSWITGDKTIDISVYDDRSGVASNSVRYKINDGSWSTPSSSLSLDLNQDGKYTIEVTSVDNVGNTNTKTAIYYVDKTKPQINFSKSTNNWTNNDVTVTVNVSDLASGIKVVKNELGVINDEKYFQSGGVVLNSNKFTVSSNGTYTVYVEDNAGNKSMATVTIGNIDKANPIISLTSNTSELISGSVTIFANITSGSKTGSGSSPIVLKKYASGNQPLSYFRTNNAGIEFKTDSFKVDDNGVYTVYAKDEAGNDSVEIISISNIDKTPPNITGTLDYPWIKGERVVNLVASDSQTTVKSFKIWDYSKNVIIKDGYANGKNMMLHHTFTEEGKTIYKVETIDALNNVADADLIIRIDNTVPTATVNVPEVVDSRNININISNIVDIHSGIKECVISESSNFTENNKKVALNGTNTNVSYTLSKKSTAQEHYNIRYLYVKLIDNVGNEKVYELKTYLKPLPPKSVTIKTPINNQLFVGGESVEITWSYEQNSNEFELTQQKVIIYLKNVDTGQVSTYTNESKTTSYIVGGLPFGQYEVSVEVFFDTNHNVSKLSNGRNFRYNYFNTDGRVVTKTIKTNSYFSKVLVVTEHEIPVGTAIEGKIYYESNGGVINESKYITFVLDSDFNINNLITLPKRCNQIQIDYTLRKHPTNPCVSPFLDNLEVYAV